MIHDEFNLWPLLPHQRMGQAWKFQAVTLAWSFWWPALTLKLPRGSQTPVISLSCKKDTLSSGDSKSLRRFCVRNQGQRPNIRTKDPLSIPYHTGNYKGFSSSVSGNRGRDYFLLYHQALWLAQGYVTSEWTRNRQHGVKTQDLGLIE